jgi:hypothetical protein
MGNSTWSASDWTATRATYATKSTREELFTQRQIKPAFDPKGIGIRESVDSDANPYSTPIILGLDVTGSMGFIAEDIARNQLGSLVTEILDNKPVSDPHIMVMAIGDIDSDQAPLQASQFEADIRIAEQLTQIWLESGGGGNGWESYDLPWLFAALKTKIDSFDKRGKKGYLFTFGDEPPPPAGHTHSKDKLERVFGKGIVERGFTSGEMLEMAQKKWAVFHVVVEQGSYARRDPKGVLAQWSELLGPNVIRLNDYKMLAQVISAVLQVAEGADIDDIILQAGEAKVAVAYSLGRNT